MLGIIAVLAPMPARAEPRPKAPAWSISRSYPAVPGTLNDVACKSATDCEAVGRSSTGIGVVMGTTDGGASWQAQASRTGSARSTASLARRRRSARPLPKPLLPPAPVSSSSPPTAAGRGKGEVPKGAVAFYGIACPSATTCTAVGDSRTGGVVIRTTNDGRTWAVQTVPKGTSLLNAVACVSSARCEAVGKLQVHRRRHRDDRRWGHLEDPAQPIYCFRISSASPAPRRRCAKQLGLVPPQA